MMLAGVNIVLLRIITETWEFGLLDMSVRGHRPGLFVAGKPCRNVRADFQGGARRWQMER